MAGAAVPVIEEKVEAAGEVEAEKTEESLSAEKNQAIVKKYLSLHLHLLCLVRGLIESARHVHQYM